MTLPASPVWLCNIGNTNTAIAYWDATILTERSSVPTAGFGSTINSFLSDCDIVVCSVVQTAFGRLHSAFAEVSAVERLHVLGSTSPYPFESNYAAGQAGADRLANVAACRELKLAPCLAVDAGTAITVDVVDKAGTFLGGAIMPGLQMSTDALHGRTDALPLVETRRETVAFPGMNTLDAIAVGVAMQAAAGIERMAQESGYNSIVLTGGSGPELQRYLSKSVIDQPDLTFVGMLAWYQFLVELRGE